ncbi:MAG: hypothetical protein ABJC12_01585 [Saprospiraceae bacterium]
MHKLISGISTISSCIFIAAFTLSCQKIKVPQAQIANPAVMAQVFQYKLTFDDIKDLIQAYATDEDSIQQVRSLTEHWVRDRLLLVEAEKNFPKEVNMNKLLEDYRQSLVMHFFEQQVIEERLDTAITETDLQRYYEANKEQHRLESGILKGFYFKIKKPLARNDHILQWWRTFPQQHYDEVIAYAAKHGHTSWSDSSEWHEMNIVIQLFPEGTLSPGGIRSYRGVVREDRDYIFLLYPTEVYYERDIAPLSRIRTQAAKYIIHQRELELLERIKKEIYDRDIQLDQVKNYTK